jgi:uncharacterized protein YggU (UPF0235/DUF167 family)
VSVLEWLLIFEGLLLAIAGILALVAMIIAKQDPTDPIAVFCNVFWREFLRPPRELPIDSDRVVAGPAKARAAVRAEEEDEESEEDVIYGRPKRDAQGRVKKSELTVLVEPNAASDEVAGRDGLGIRVRVTGEAGDSRSNKALVEIVANAMGVKPYQVTLTKGHYQTRKVVQVQGVTPEELEGRLANLPGAE